MSFCTRNLFTTTGLRLVAHLRRPRNQFHGAVHDAVGAHAVVPRTPGNKKRRSYHLLLPAFAHARLHAKFISK